MESGSTPLPPDHATSTSTTSTPTPTPSAPTSTEATTAPKPTVYTTTDPKKLASKKRRKRKREEVQSQCEDPGLKDIHLKHRQQAKSQAVEVQVDVGDLAHTKPAWTGLRTAEDGSTMPPLQGTSTATSTPSWTTSTTGLGIHNLTQEQIDKLTGTVGFEYIYWLGLLTIPILDVQRRIIALLGGMPRDVEGWKATTNEVAELMEAQRCRTSFSDANTHHRWVDSECPYACISCGVSHRCGQLQPGELCNTETHELLASELRQHPCFKSLDSFANSLMRTFTLTLFLFCLSAMTQIATWPHLHWNFVGSVFAACTFNFSPHTITAPHLDFGNLAWGWCSITALGNFDPDCGGHLILWDLKLIIRFPPGSTILIPSAILRHSNVRIRPHERRYSFTQYSAGGLF
ncbi:hypothetical protein C8J57DRAFT_1212279 [Mycena rebaudengoi]|nr:hypothetical protein C8J57DRAFT_1212279 [Mycena rebaudengoi]